MLPAPAPYVHDVPAPMVPTCVWRTTPEVVLALDERFGDPLDAYVNGSQVWLRDDGPGGITLEWRLHPVAGYRRPAGVATEEVFAAVVLALRSRDDPSLAALAALAVPAAVWDGLEAFPAYGDETEPTLLQAAVTEALGIPPDAAGLADHAAIGDAWERARGGLSVVEELFRQLAP